MFTEIGKRMDEHSKNINKVVKNIRKYQVEVIELKKFNNYTEKYTRGI